MHKANSRNAQGKLYTKVGRVVFRLGAGRSVGGVGRADMAAAARAHEALSSFGGWVGRDRLGAAPRECREKR